MGLFSKQLEAFVAVAEELHFGRAAQRLHVSQPPLSQQLKQFEEWVGVTLVERTTRSVVLTPAGEAMLASVQRLLADGAHAVERARRIASGEAGQLRIGFTSSAAYRLVPAVVASYRRSFPAVRLAMEEGRSPELRAALESDRIDVALMRYDSRLPGNELEYIEVDREPLIAAMPARHALAARDTVPIAALRDADVITFARDASPYFHALLNELFLRNRVRPRAVMESVLPTLLSLVASGIGVALVPASARDLRTKGVAYRPLSGKVAMDAVMYAVHRKGPANPAVAAFVAAVHGMAGSSRAGGPVPRLASPSAARRARRLL